MPSLTCSQNFLHYTLDRPGRRRRRRSHLSLSLTPRDDDEDEEIAEFKMQLQIPIKVMLSRLTPPPAAADLVQIVLAAVFL